jgi:DNA mismatch endonuclease (patch repair protein)
VTPKRDPAVTSRLMSRIKSKNTKAELVLGKAMWKLGLRYRKHYPITGYPDFAFVSSRLAIFCDGDFWHGRDFENMIKSGRFENNPSYWIPKISRTIERDKKTIQALNQDGWIVIRFWESDIYNNSDDFANQIFHLVRGKDNLQ